MRPALCTGITAWGLDQCRPGAVVALGSQTGRCDLFSRTEGRAVPCEETPLSRGSFPDGVAVLSTLLAGSSREPSLAMVGHCGRHRGAFGSHCDPGCGETIGTVRRGIYTEPREEKRSGVREPWPRQGQDLGLGVWEAGWLLVRVPTPGGGHSVMNSRTLGGHPQQLGGVGVVARAHLLRGPLGGPGWSRL